MTPGKRKGFTLLEVLVAVAILAVIMTTLHIILVGAIDAPRAVAESMREPLALASVADVIRADLEAVALYCEPDRPLRLASTGRSKEFEFVRFGPPLDPESEPGGLYRVTYKLATRSDGTRQLGRREELYRDKGGVRVYSTDIEREHFTPLMTDVKDFTVKLHDGVKWRVSWKGNKIPGGAKINIELESGRKNEFIVFLPTAMVEGKETKSGSSK